MADESELAKESRRDRALDLAVQLHVARAVNGGLSQVGDECLSLDTIDTAKIFEAYLKGDGE